MVEGRFGEDGLATDGGGVAVNSKWGEREGGGEKRQEGGREGRVKKRDDDEMDKGMEKGTEG